MSRISMGWSQGVNRWGDSRPIAHLIQYNDTDPAPRQAFNACGSVGNTHGSVYPEPTAHACLRCLRVINKQKGAA